MPRDGLDLQADQPAGWRRWLAPSPPPAPDEGALALYGVAWGRPADGAAQGGRDMTSGDVALSTGVQPGQQGMLRLRLP